MHKTRCVVEFKGEEISLFFEVLDETLRVWSEKGFESEEEKAEFQRISSVASKLHEAMGETTINGILKPKVSTAKNVKKHSMTPGN